MRLQVRRRLNPGAPGDFDAIEGRAVRRAQSTIDKAEARCWRDEVQIEGGHNRVRPI